MLLGGCVEEISYGRIRQTCISCSDNTVGDMRHGNDPCSIRGRSRGLHGNDRAHLQVTSDGVSLNLTSRVSILECPRCPRMRTDRSIVLRPVSAPSAPTWETFYGTNRLAKNQDLLFRHLLLSGRASSTLRNLSILHNKSLPSPRLRPQILPNPLSDSCQKSSAMSSRPQTRYPFRLSRHVSPPPRCENL